MERWVGTPCSKSGRPLPPHLQMEINYTKVERAPNGCCVMWLLALAKNERQVILLIFVLMLHHFPSYFLSLQHFKNTWIILLIQ